MRRCGRKRSWGLAKRMVPTSVGYFKCKGKRAFKTRVRATRGRAAGPVSQRPSGFAASPSGARRRRPRGAGGTPRTPWNLRIGWGSVAVTGVRRCWAGLPKPSFWVGPRPLTGRISCAIEGRIQGLYSIDSHCNLPRSVLVCLGTPGFASGCSRWIRFTIQCLALLRLQPLT
jgi:hypothetical protein